MARCFDCFHCDVCKQTHKAAFPECTEVQIMAVMSRENSCKNFKATADVVEVKHGRWVRYKENCLYNRCSRCLYEHCCEPNYCPNCGARMDGVDDGEK